jgi:photosystem II stability/assembly factor-like uncharacterized protein
MTKILTLLPAILWTLASPLLAQESGWRWQNPVPQGNALNDIQVASESVAYAAGDHGTIVKSTNAGQHWELVNFPAVARLTELQFLDKNRGWVKGDRAGRVYLYRTTDGGSSWTQEIDLPATRIGFHFQSPERGWLAVDSVVFRTSDGGLSWEESASVPARISQIYFVDSSNGWALAGSKLFHSTDGGFAWQSVPLDSIDWYGLVVLKKIQFVTADVGWLIAGSFGPNHTAGLVLGTTDGGLHWKEQLQVGIDFADYRTFTDIEFRNTELGWAVSYGEVFRTTDGGQTWTSVGFANYLRVCAPVDDARLLGGGVAGATFASADSGSSWQRTFRGFLGELNDVMAVDSSLLFAGGGHTLLRTRDGGSLWEELPVSVAGVGYFTIRSIWFLDSLRGWAGYESTGGWGGLLRTTDGGHSWTVQVGEIHRIFTVFFLDDSLGWFASGDHVYKTTDSGDSWFVAGSISPYVELESVFFATSDSGWAGGYLGLARSVYGGSTWQLVDVDSTSRFVSDIQFTSALRGWVIGDGFMYRTTNGGASWENRSDVLPPGASPSGVHFIDQDRGWVVGRNFGGKILATSDGGDAWTLLDVPTDDPLLRVRFTKDGHGWILGSSGSILRLAAPAVLSVGGEEGASAPAELSLLQNYPNPFNASTVFSFSVPSSSPVLLKVYDLLGREIATVVDERLERGTYRRTFDWRDVPSGVYFYRLQAGGAAETKKFVVLR